LIVVNVQEKIRANWEWLVKEKPERMITRAVSFSN